MAAPFKFFHIGKANEEITRLEGELAKLTTERDALQGNDSEISAAAEKIKGELATAGAKAVQLEADLATARQSISTLTGERDSARAELVIAETKLANPAPEIKAAASAQAAAIVAQVGHTKPIAAAPTQTSEPRTWAEKAVAAAEARAAQRTN